MKKALPIKVNASVHTECWTYNKLCILETSPYAEAWLSSNFGIYMNSDYVLHFGTNKEFYHNEYSNILDVTELDYWRNPPNVIIKTIEDEISKGNYMIVYLMLSVEKHKIHEFVFYGFDSEKRELYTLMLYNGKFREETVSYDWFISRYKNLYDYHLYNPDNVAWFGANFFPITKAKLRDDFNDSICFVESMRRFSEEIYGKKIAILNPITSNEEQYLTGIECINGISIRIKEYIRDKQFIKDDILKNLSFELRRNICKLYEHQCVVNRAMRWILREIGVKDDNHYIQLHWGLCRKIEKLAMLSIKFEVSGVWENISKIEKGFENLYDDMKETLNNFIDRVTAFKKESNIDSYNKLLKECPSILSEMEHFYD